MAALNESSGPQTEHGHHSAQELSLPSDGARGVPTVAQAGSAGQPKTAEILLQHGNAGPESWPFSSDPRTRGRGSWVALVCGVVSLLGGILYGWTLPLALCAITLGLVGAIRGRGHLGNNIGALVCGLIGAGLSIGWIVYSIIVINVQS